MRNTRPLTSALPLATLTILTLVIPLTGPASAQNDESTETSGEARKRAQVVLDQALKAFGGVETYRRTLDCRIVAKHVAVASEPAMRVEYEVVLQARADGATHLSKTVWGQRQVLATDGKTHWGTMDGAALELPEKLVQVLDLERMVRGILVDHDKLGYVPRSAPRGDGDQQLDRVTFRKRGTKRSAQQTPGDVLVFFFDRETHLPARVRLLVPDPYGGEDFFLTIRYAEYGKVDGVPYAKQLEHLRDGRPLVNVEVTEIEIGKSFPDAVFRRPTPAD